MPFSARRLRDYRKAAGLTQGDLGGLLGISHAAISQWELGISRPEIDRLPNLAAALDAPLADLFD